MQNSKVQLLTNEDEVVDAQIQGPLMVARGQRARFLVRAKCIAFRPEQVLIDEAQDWKVYDFNIHGRSQFNRTGNDEEDAMPGDVLGLRRQYETAQTAMSFWLDVVYTGPRPDAPFVCTIRGIAAK